MATMAHRATPHVESHYFLGGLIGIVAGLAMAIPAMLYTLVIGEVFFAVPIGIAAAFLGPEAAGALEGVVFGLLVHLSLSFIIGVAFAVGVRFLLRKPVENGMSLLWPGIALGIVIWAFNWYLFLPAAYPEFLKIMGAGPALIVHTIFGATLALYSRAALHE